MSSMTLNMLLMLKDMASGPLGKFRDNLKHISHDFMAIGATANSMGRKILDGMQIPIKTFMAAEDASIRLETTMMRSNGKVEASFGKINELAIQLGNRLPGNTADFQNMFAVLQQNSIKPETILGGLGEATANLAVLLKQDFSEMAQSMAQISKSAGISAKDMLPFADTLQKIAHQSVSVTNMGYAFSKASGMLQKFGIQGNEAASAFAPIMVELLQLGHSGETVGTNLTSMMNNLSTFERGGSKSAKQAQQSLKAMGIELDIFDNKSGNLRGPRHMIQELEKIKSLSRDKQSDIISSIFGTGQDAEFAQTIISGGVKKYDELVADAKNQANLNQRIAKVLTSLANIWDAAVGTFENTMVAFIEPIAPELKKLADGFSQLAAKAGEFMKAHPQLTKFAAGFALMSGSALVAGGTTVMGLGMAMSAANSAMPAFTKLGEGAGKLKGKLGDMTKGAKAWNAATGAQWVSNAQAAGNSLKSFPTTVGNSFKQMGASVKAMPTNMGNSVRQMGTALRAIPANAGGSLRNVGAALRTMPANVGGAIRTLPASLNALRIASGARLLSALRGAIMGIRALSLAALANPFGLIAAAIVVAALLVYKFWGPISGFFRGIWKGLMQGLAPIKGAFTKAFAPLAPILRPIMSALKQVWNFLVNLLSPMADVGGKGEAMGTKVGLALAKMITKGLEVLSFFTGMAAKFVTFGAQMMQGLLSGIMSGAGAVLAKIGEIAGQIKSKFAGLLGIHSPSRVFMSFGHNLGEGLQMGMSARTGQIAKAANLMATAAMPKMATPAFPSAGRAGSGLAGSGVSGGGFVVHFNPTIQVNAPSQAGVRDQVQAGLQLSMHELERMLERIDANRRRRSA